MALQIYCSFLSELLRDLDGEFPAERSNQDTADAIRPVVRADDRNTLRLSRRQKCSMYKSPQPGCFIADPSSAKSVHGLKPVAARLDDVFPAPREL